MKRKTARGFGKIFTEPLIDSVAHLRHIFSHLLLSEKLDVHPVHLALFAIEDEKNCTESVPPQQYYIKKLVESQRYRFDFDHPMVEGYKG